MTSVRDIKVEAITKAQAHCGKMYDGEDIDIQYLNGIMAADVVFGVWAAEGGYDMLVIKGAHLIAGEAMNFTVDAVPCECVHAAAVVAARYKQMIN